MSGGGAKESGKDPLPLSLLQGLDSLDTLLASIFLSTNRSFEVYPSDVRDRGDVLWLQSKISQRCRMTLDDCSKHVRH